MIQQHLNQLHVVVNAEPTSGGEALAALRYAQSIAQAGGRITLLSQVISGEQAREQKANSQFEQLTATTRRNWQPQLIALYRFTQRLCEQKQINLIHIHGMWSPFLAVVALVAHTRKLPLVISPHGCLEPRALRYKYIKKQLALNTYQGAILRSASLFVATAERELNSLRRFGYRQPIAVIPNGIDIGTVPQRGSHGEIRTLLFLSRLHPIKGLLDLVEAWATVRRPGWRIVIAGGDEDGYRAKVENLIRLKGLESDFEFVGFVEGARKQDCFDQADVFVLPTHSENFGIAVAEALANELPVITTTGAPWSDLVEYRCGWWVESGVQGISKALIEAMECDPVELRKMGQRGRRLVMEKYSWERIGVTALGVSSWLLDQSQPKPEAVKVYGD